MSEAEDAFELLKAQARAKADAWARASAGRQPWMVLPLDEGTPPGPLTERFLDRQLARVTENRTRQQKLVEEDLRRSALKTPEAYPSELVRARAQETTRLAFGQLLSEAIENGLLTEDRAVAMILAGGINDQPLTPDQAREQVALTIAQALKSDAVDSVTARALLALLETGAPATPPRADPLAPPLLDLQTRIQRLEGILYDALIIRPCHDSAHDELHRAAPALCEAQCGQLTQALLRGLGLPPDGLPRAVHGNPDGSRASCCARDGRIGTWLRYGQTVAPGSPPVSSDIVTRSDS